MEERGWSRIDTVWLALAAVLVVAIAAGGGILLMKRSENAGATSTAGTDVRLAPIEATVPPVPKTAAPPVPTGPPKVPAGPQGTTAQLAYVTKVRTSGGSYTIYADPAVLLTGASALTSARKAGAVGKTAASVPGGYFIANETHNIKTYDLSSKVTILVRGKRAGVLSTATVAAFVGAFPGGSATNSVWQKSAWWIFPDGDDNVLRIEQFHVP